MPCPYPGPGEGCSLSGAACSLGSFLSRNSGLLTFLSRTDQTDQDQVLTRLQGQTQTCLSWEAWSCVYSVVSTAWGEEP